MQTKRLFLIAIFYCVLYSFTNAQVDFRQFPLDSFKLPEIDRSTMVITGSLLGDYTNLDIAHSNSYTNSNFAPIATVSYSRFVNRTDLQRNSFASISQNLRLRHSESVFSDPVSTTDYSSFLFVSENNRRYKGNSFIETGGALNTNYSIDKTTVNDRRVNFFRGGIEPIVGFGKGRIEPVSDVAMAMFVLKDAIELGLDAATLTTEDIYSFASLMAEVRNRRIFDSRRMRIAELRDLYAYMLSEEWVIPNDPGFFTVLTDNWIYNNISFRNTGKRWSYLLQPRVEYLYFRSIDSTLPAQEENQTEIGTALLVDFIRYKTVSLFRDNVRHHTLSVGITSRSPDEAPKTFLSVEFDNSIGRNWYPNSRTNLELALNGRYEYHRYTDAPEGLLDPDEHYARVGLTGETTYFLSYKTRLVGNALFAYAYDSGGFIVPHFINNIASFGKSTGIEARISGSIIISLF